MVTLPAHSQVPPDLSTSSVDLKNPSNASPAVSESLGSVEHQLLRRITVFPLRTDTSLADVAEEAWWKMREALTADRRFLVASKNFLMQKDVFQSRGELNPADAIILGRLLDANGLVTTFLKEKTLYMRVYDGEYGRTLWHQEYRLQPSISVAKQLVRAAEKLMLSFVAAVPYQGFVVMDSLSGKTVIREGNKSWVNIEVGENSSIAIGDHVQWIRLRSDSLRPLFMDGTHIEIFAEGRVTSINRNILTAELLRATRWEDIREFTLVRFPSESQRLREAYGLRSSEEGGRLTSEFLAPGLSGMDREEAEKKPLVATLSFVFNLAAFLILAF